LVVSSCSHAQNNRISDQNQIGWFSTTGTLIINSKWSAHLEYQWRRDEWVKNWQQSLFWTGINYHVNANITVRAGYAWIVTYAYEDIPLQSLGKSFTEYWFYQVATLPQKNATP
jgi:hypothetical protein